MQHHCAARQQKNDAALIARLVADGVQVDARDVHGATALLAATHANAAKAAKVLIDAGADVNAKDNIQDSPYLYAGARGHGHVETVRTLIEAGTEVDHVNRLHWTALLEAIIRGDGGPRYRQIVELLIEAVTDVNLTNELKLPFAEQSMEIRHRPLEGSAEPVLCE